MSKFSYSRVAQIALNYFAVNLEKIEEYKKSRLSEKKCAYIYYGEFEEEEEYDEFHFWEGTQEEFEERYFNIYIDLGNTDVDLFCLMNRFLEHES